MVRSLQNFAHARSLGYRLYYWQNTIMESHLKDRLDKNSAGYSMYADARRNGRGLGGFEEVLATVAGNAGIMKVLKRCKHCRSRIKLADAAYYGFLNSFAGRPSARFVHIDEGVKDLTAILLQKDSGIYVIDDLLGTRCVRTINLRLHRV